MLRNLGRILFLINVNLVNIVYFSQDYILLKARNMNRIQWKVRIFPMM